MSSHTLSKLAHRCAQVLTPLIWGPWRTRAVSFGCQEPHRVPQCAVPVLSFATCARVCLQEGGKNLVSRAPARTRDRLCWNRECPVPQQGALGSPRRGERACPAPPPAPRGFADAARSLRPHLRNGTWVSQSFGPSGYVFPPTLSQPQDPAVVRFTLVQGDT